MASKLSTESILGVLLGLSLAACNQKTDAQPEPVAAESSGVAAAAVTSAAPAEPTAAAAQAPDDAPSPAEKPGSAAAEKPGSATKVPTGKPLSSAVVAAKEVGSPKPAPSASGKQMGCAPGKCGAGSCG